MKSFLIATALFSAILIFAFSKPTAAIAPRSVELPEAADPWMYPVVAPASTTFEQLNLLAVRKGFVETLGVKIFTSASRVVPADVSSFKDIVKWYADSFGETKLCYFLDNFVKTGISGPGTGIFEAAPAAPSTHLTYRFTRQEKQITILHTEETGDVVTISLLGLEHETSIQVLRHHSADHNSTAKTGSPSR